MERNPFPFSIRSDCSSWDQSRERLPSKEEQPSPSRPSKAKGNFRSRFLEGWRNDSELSAEP
ncbi:MAG: hypothetical protein ACTS43_01275 [Candidatus Hodgkinia cicadicola]